MASATYGIPTCNTLTRHFYLSISRQGKESAFNSFTWEGKIYEVKELLTDSKHKKSLQVTPSQMKTAPAADKSLTALLNHYAKEIQTELNNAYNEKWVQFFDKLHTESHSYLVDKSELQKLSVREQFIFSSLVQPKDCRSRYVVFDGVKFELAVEYRENAYYKASPSLLQQIRYQDKIKLLPEKINEANVMNWFTNVEQARSSLKHLPQQQRGIPNFSLTAIAQISSPFSQKKAQPVEVVVENKIAVASEPQTKELPSATPSEVTQSETPAQSEPTQKEVVIKHSPAEICPAKQPPFILVDVVRNGECHLYVTFPEVPYYSMEQHQRHQRLLSPASDKCLTAQKDTNVVTLLCEKTKISLDLVCTEQQQRIKDLEQELTRVTLSVHILEVYETKIGELKSKTVKLTSKASVVAPPSEADLTSLIEQLADLQNDIFSAFLPFNQNAHNLSQSIILLKKELKVFISILNEMQKIVKITDKIPKGKISQWSASSTTLLNDKIPQLEHRYNALVQLNQVRLIKMMQPLDQIEDTLLSHMPLKDSRQEFMEEISVGASGVGNHPERCGISNVKLTAKKMVSLKSCDSDQYGMVIVSTDAIKEIIEKNKDVNPYTGKPFKGKDVTTCTLTSFTSQHNALTLKQKRKFISDPQSVQQTVIVAPAKHIPWYPNRITAELSPQANAINVLCACTEMALTNVHHKLMQQTQEFSEQTPKYAAMTSKIPANLQESKTLAATKLELESLLAHRRKVEALLTELNAKHNAMIKMGNELMDQRKTHKAEVDTLAKVADVRDLFPTQQWLKDIDDILTGPVTEFNNAANFVVNPQRNALKQEIAEIKSQQKQYAKQVAQQVAARFDNAFWRNARKQRLSSEQVGKLKDQIHIMSTNERQNMRCEERVIVEILPPASLNIRFEQGVSSPYYATIAGLKQHLSSEEPINPFSLTPLTPSEVKVYSAKEPKKKA